MRLVNYLGKFLISVGVGILMFVAWTLWGTGFYTEQQQALLEDEFERLPAAVAAADPAGDGPTRAWVRGLEAGDAVFRLRIPEIDVNSIVVEGVGVDELKRGPGHYPECRSGFQEPLCLDLPGGAAWPGQDERVIVSGHRTTYGQPFFDLDKVERGDEIVTETKWGDFTYEITEKRVIEPDDLSVTLPTGKAEIVLTTCNPKFSAAQRLIVVAEMVEDG